MRERKRNYIVLLHFYRVLLFFLSNTKKKEEQKERKTKTENSADKLVSRSLCSSGCSRHDVWDGLGMEQRKWMGHDENMVKQNLRKNETIRQPTYDIKINFNMKLCLLTCKKTEWHIFFLCIGCNLVSREKKLFICLLN